MAVAPESHRLPFSPEVNSDTLYAYGIFFDYHSTYDGVRQLRIRSGVSLCFFIVKKQMRSALVADLLGHADTRMVETTYARTRHEGVMKQRQAVENLNAFL